MTVNDLVHRLEGNDRYEYFVESNGSVTIADKGILVGGERDHHPVTNFTVEALEPLTWPQVAAYVAKPYDVDHITRVTGCYAGVQTSLKSIASPSQGGRYYTDRYPGPHAHG